MVDSVMVISVFFCPDVVTAAMMFVFPARYPVDRPRCLAHTVGFAGA
jgi:hypothetical protein